MQRFTVPLITWPLMALAIYAFAAGYIMSVIPLISVDYGIAQDFIHWLTSAFYLGLLFGSVKAESLIKPWGNKRSFIVSLWAFGLTLVLMPFFTHPIAWLGLRFLAGISVAILFVAVESWLMQSEQQQRAKRLGFYMITLYGGGMCGQLFIGKIPFEHHWPFFFSALLMLLATGVLLKAKPPQSIAMPEVDVVSAPYAVTKITHSAMIGSVVSGLLLASLYGLMPLELSRRAIDSDRIGALMACMMLGGFLVQLSIPWLSQWLSKTLLMAAFCLLGAIASASMILSSGLLSLALVFFILGMAAFALYPIAINLACQHAHASQIVHVTQWMLFMYSIGSVIGPVLASWFARDQAGMAYYLLLTMLSTCFYMLVISVKTKPAYMANE